MKPLNQFFSFTVYASREDYETRTGKKAEPWNPNRPLKYWADENPTNTEFDEIRGEEAVYRPVMSIQANGRYREGADGQPVTGSIRIPVDEAKTYNFPPYKGIFPVLGEVVFFGEEVNQISDIKVDGTTKITEAHIRNTQRTVQPPLNLPEGSRVVYAPGIGAIAVVLLKGESLPTLATGCNCDPVKIAHAIIAEFERRGFPNPASK